MPSKRRYKPRTAKKGRKVPRVPKKAKRGLSVAQMKKYRALALLHQQPRRPDGFTEEE